MSSVTIARFINEIGFKIRAGDVNKVNKTFLDLKNTASKILGSIAVGVSLTAINGLVEEFTRVKDQVKNSTAGLGEQVAIQEKILAAASATRSEYSQTAGMVSNLVKENSELFGTIDEAIKFNNAATMLFKTAGKTNEEIAGLMEAINKSFAKGYVDSETLSQMLEKSPEAVELLNKRLGTTSDQLEQMAADGKFTVEDLKAAFIDSAAEIEAKFGNVKRTVTEAITVIRNKWGLWLADTNEMLGITDTIGNAMVKGFDAVIRIITKLRTSVVWLSDKLGGMNNMVKFIAIAAGAMLFAFNFSKITSGIANVIVALKNLNKQSMLMAAKIILIALLVDDFINFMQGNDSVIGTLLENAGVDVDEFRENILKIWKNIQTVLSAIWKGIQNVAIPIFEGIWQVIQDVFNAIGEIIDKVAPKFADLIDQIANGDVDTETWTKIGEAIAALTAIIIGVIAVIKVLNTVMAIANAVMAASPIIWIVAAIVALIAIIALLIIYWDEVKAAAAKCWAWIKGVWNSVADWFKSSVIDPVVGFFSSLWTSIVNFFTSAWEGVKNVWSAVVGWFQGVWNGIVGIFSAIGAWFSGIFTSAWEGIKNAFSAVGSFFQGIWNTITSMFTNIGVSIGDGISGAFKSVVNGVIGFAGKIINGFIDSINWAIGVINKIPGVNISKLSRIELQGLAEGGYIGANKPTPVVIGDNKSEGEIVSPISKMRDTVADALNMFLAARKPSNTTQMMANSTVTRSVVQNVEINNEFHGDTAIQKKTAGAMKKASTDVTAELARGLACIG